MTKHISVRLAWHNDGWNGHICKKPKENVYCVGQHSYPGEMIAERRDLNWEEKIAGISCTKLKEIPPCIYSINAFGKEKLRAYSDPPVWFKDDSKRKHWDLPPASVCTWPYEEMYRDEVKNPKGKEGTYNYEKRLELAKKYFEEITPDKSLIFYYANYSNPFSEDEVKKYVAVGISQLRSLGDYHFYDGTSEENKKKYAGGFVWQKTITSYYPDQGFRLPYHLYLDKPEIINRLLFIPENARNFKYATRHISDDDALDLIEQFLEIVKNLIDLRDKSEDWEHRRDWLQSLIAELWQNRGVYPGLPKVLDYLGFQDAIQYFKSEVAKNKEKEARETTFLFLDGKLQNIPGLKLDNEIKKRVQRQWKLKGNDEQNLLREIFPRIDLSKDQIEKILSSERDSNGIRATLEEISGNPYILSEQFIGEDPDDRISFNKIDHGALPSPELGLKPLVERDDWKRLRALCVEQLKKEEKHTFIALDKVIHSVNDKLSFLPEWKRHQFNERYFEVDEAYLSKALVFREREGRKYIYLKAVFEDEREIETELRKLAKRPDIVFKSPVTEKHWHDFLYDVNSPIAIKNPEEYKRAIEGQVEVCQKIFTKPICVLSGAAGTGKTFMIQAIIKAIEKAHGAGTSFQLLAPTGKAVDRIRKKTDKSASTIHSFLAERGWLYNNLTFKRTGGKCEEGFSTYIVDEASMLDLGLAAALFRAINWASVQRLIFVGDPNQLPPIGRGRIFSDVIEWLKEQNPDSVGILKRNVRQEENRLANKGTGILKLASLYIRESLKSGDKKGENKAFAEELLKRVQEGGDVDKDLRILYWKNTDELEKLLVKTIIADLEKDTGERFNEKKRYELWSKVHKGGEENQKTDYQQVISPYRGELFGIENLNSLLQESFNGHNKNKGTLGGITLFDKVIQYVNRPKSNPYYAYNIKSRRKEKIEVYNGEIGFVKPHAFDKHWKWQGFRPRHFQVVFSRKENCWVELSESDVEENIELAYAISVHKAQGSEFKRVYFVLPKSKKSLLSTELLYTGISRAQEHLTLFVEEDVSPLLSLRRPEKSHLSGINSSLFDFRPVPDEILRMNEWYEEGKIHHTLSEYMVRSKSEVIIANILHDRAIPFKYEFPLFAPDGTFYLPDFTVTWRGEQWYWEHLGLIENNEDYRNHWAKKKEWYHKHFPDRLLTTSESVSLSKDAESIIEKYFK